MHDSTGIPASFSSGERQTGEKATVGRSGQSVFMSVYRTRLAGQYRSITVTWCKNLLLHGLSVSVQGPNPDEHYQCKVEMKPWHFWRKQGSMHFAVDGRRVEVVWDIKSAKFNGETEPQSDYYVAIVCEEEVVLVLGDSKKDAYRKTGCRPSLIDPILVSRREHVFGKKKFSTKVRLDEKGNFHGISIECNNSDGFDPRMEIKVDGKLAINVKHLQWKFRGNEFINLGKNGVEVYWDVHDWLFGSGPRHGLFIFKPISSAAAVAPPVPTASVSTASSPNLEGLLMNPGSRNDDHSSFCLFLHAWKVE
ncbi:hypothetical protein SLA2020_463830 [Shorea laevis]